MAETLFQKKKKNFFVTASFLSKAFKKTTVIEVLGDISVLKARKKSRAYPSLLKLTAKCAVASRLWEYAVTKEDLKRKTGMPRTILYITPHSCLQFLHKISSWCSQLFDNFRPLINMIRTREKNSASDQLTKNTTNRPNIN